MSSEDCKTQISWTGSEAECRDAVCAACSYRRCGESPRAKLQRVSSEDSRTPVCGQTVKQNAEMRSALLPTMLWGKSPCEVAESVIRRLQNTISWTGSEAECRDGLPLRISRRSPKLFWIEALCEHHGGEEKLFPDRAHMD